MVLVGLGRHAWAIGQVICTNIMLASIMLVQTRQGYTGKLFVRTIQ